MLGERAGLRDPVTLHNFYVPAGGDIPDPAGQSEIRPQARRSSTRCATARTLRCNGADRMILVGDLNVAPLEHDVWSHKQMLRVVSHTPIECEKLTAAQKTGGWVDAMRMRVPEPAKLYTWWSYRAPDWETADKGRRLDHIWMSPALADRVADLQGPQELSRLDAAVRPRAGDGDAGSCKQSIARQITSARARPMRAHVVDLARRLIGARRHDVAQLARGVRDSLPAS